MTDPFFPDRPTHADFEALITIIQAMDTQAALRDNYFVELLAATVDDNSLIYLASQRILRLFGPDSLTADQAGRILALYLEGFLLGYAYTKEG